MAYIPTEKQADAWRLLREGPTHVMLVGGSRSGKTTVIDEEIVCRAVRYPGSRHLIARLRFAHAKTSLWLDTLPKILEMEGIKREAVKINESDHFIQFPNGSEIWVDGLDDKERVEKVLGREYASLHLNEISQIGYPSVMLVLTRLAQKIPGCLNKAYYDLNPVGRKHWGYQQFIQKKNPSDGSPLKNPENYAHMIINPVDNVENLPEGYIEDILGSLPEDKRRRFKEGEWGDPEGVIFKNWDIIDEIPERVIRHAQKSCGLDFGFSVHPAALTWIGAIGDDIYIDELIYETGLTNKMIAQKIKMLGIDETTYADSAEPKSIRELRDYGVHVVGAKKGPDSIRQGIDWLLGKRIHVTRRSGNIQNELMNYEWKTDRLENMLPVPVDDYNHSIDSIRYGTGPLRDVRRVAGRLGR